MDKLGNQYTQYCINICPVKWCCWEQNICKRGVRQGDPHSPLLYIIAADLLQSIINAAWANGEITLPTNQAYGLDYPIIQYADDTLLFLNAEKGQLGTLKSVLYSFSGATGL